MNIDAVSGALTKMAERMEGDKGPLELCGLFLRDESPGLWDYVIAAPWLKGDELSSFQFVSNQLRQSLSNSDLIGLSKIVILERGAAILDYFLEHFEGKKGAIDINFVVESGVVIRRAYLIVVRRLPQTPGPGQKTAKKRPKTESARKVGRSSAGMHREP